MISPRITLNNIYTNKSPRLITDPTEISYIDLNKNSVNK